MSRGWIRIERDLFDDSWFCNGPATRFHAWADLIQMAAHKAISKRLPHGQVELQRGQLTVSIRFLAERWQWSRTTVDRFLASLVERDSLVRDVCKKRDSNGTETGTGQLVLTIRNYDKFQSPEAPRGTGYEQDAGQDRDRTGTGFGTKYNKEQLNNLPLEESPLTPQGGTRRRSRRERGFIEPDLTVSDNFAAFWDVYPRRVGKQAAKALFERYRPEHQLVLIGAAKRFAAKMHAEKRPLDKTPYPATWLNPDNGQFADELKDERRGTERRTEDPQQRDSDAGSAEDRSADDGELFRGGKGVRHGDGNDGPVECSSPGGSSGDGSVAGVSGGDRRIGTLPAPVAFPSDGDSAERARRDGFDAHSIAVGDDWDRGGRPAWVH